MIEIQYHLMNLKRRAHELKKMMNTKLIKGFLRLGLAVEKTEKAFDDLLEAWVPYELYRGGSLPKDRRKQ